MSHHVQLSWTASTDQVDGYNIYRGTQASGGEASAPINPALITGLAFTDTLATVGEYDYYATAVKSGVESIHSNEVNTVILPQPPTGLAATQVD